ncbi:bifunctional diguanylate cyclase/phosphodiesterase [Paenibacillus hexagrammi]|uniref:EAL domain-containing protein n=1 Tax=Paenibacillus hexagrammi TaxID=2908839 RepID=A0ABY3SGE0_9BACL|nr:EAL domain-containing protein [Paenibacillus sp. YPD9-1]UJF32155.1 EAL domain-containing protein [Paenibacillus sp. YPD9-1]
MRKFHYVIVTLIFLALIPSVEATLKDYQASLLKELRTSEESQLISEANSLKSVIERNVNLMGALEAYVRSDYLLHRSSDEDVQNFLASLYGEVESSAFNLIIAPHGIAKFVYPLSGNENFVNWNLLQDDRQDVQLQIQRALQTKEMTLNGPFKLLQGNNGLVARKAIYQDGMFWGFVSVGLDMDHLLKESGIKEKSKSDLQLAIRVMGLEAFYGDKHIFEQHPMYSTIVLAHDEVWELAALPPENSLKRIAEQIIWIRCSYLSVLLLGLLFYLYIVRQKNNLSIMVEERTQALRIANEDLTAMNEELLAGEHELQEFTVKLQESEQQLSYIAYHDMLTGISNRAYFLTALQSSIEQAETSGMPISILFFDLDNFKIVNDSQGHHTGDLLLQGVVERIRHAEVPIDLFARFGGDEFAILLKGYSEDKAIEQVCEQLLDLFKLPFHISGKMFFANISVGIAMYPSGGTTGEELLKNADIAMYTAKNDSGSTYRFFNKQMETNSISKLEMGNHLREALDRGELEIVYQPQVDCSIGEISGVEALLRWNHTTKGYVSPGEFIPLAEEMGLIVPIGEWILRGACEQMKKWQSLLGKPLPISVNLSVRQLHDDKLVDKVQRILQETGLDACCLEMEITENVAMQEEQLDALRELRKLGVAISVDDFGTQYSSLSYLKRFPVTKIKLDQSFVRGVHSDDKDQAMIKAIISVARSFDLDIIAEGVETEAQASFLVASGCNQIQGYYFYRPMSAAQTEQVLLESQWKMSNLDAAAASE